MPTKSEYIENELAKIGCYLFEQKLFDEWRQFQSTIKVYNILDYAHVIDSEQIILDRLLQYKLTTEQSDYMKRRCLNIYKLMKL